MRHWNALSTLELDNLWKAPSRNMHPGIPHIGSLMGKGNPKPGTGRDRTKGDFVVSVCPKTVW